MKTIKAWAVFDNEGKIDQNSICLKSEIGAWNFHVQNYFGTCNKKDAQEMVNIEKERGFTVKPITITWEE